MAASNLYQYYGNDPAKISPNQSVDERFALPGFADAATKAGYTKDTYKIDMNNEGANSKILANLPPSQLIVTSTPAVNQGAKDSADLASLLSTVGRPNQTGTDTSKDTTGDTPAYSDSFTTALDNVSATSSAGTKSLMASINAGYQNSVNRATSDADSYKRGLQLLGVQHNEATFSPDLLASHITKAGNDVATKLQSLEMDKNKALMDAEVARENGDLATLKAKMDYVRQVKQDQQTAITSAYDTLSKQSTAAGVEAHAIYDTMQTLNPADHEAFIQAVAQKYNIPVMSLVTALGDEKKKRNLADIDLQNKKRVAAGGTGTNSTSTSKAQVAQGQNTLNTGIAPDGTKIGNPKGKDGFYDPGVYAQAFNEWPGSAKSFVSNYPMVGGINPESYALLPEALQELLPKTSSSTSRSS